MSKVEWFSGQVKMVVLGVQAVFLKKGFNAATTDMIQRAAGISKSMVHICYPAKEALFESVIVTECERALRAVSEIAPSQNDIRGVLSGVTRAYMNISILLAYCSLFASSVMRQRSFTWGGSFIWWGRNP
jgi:AcrR family transcriptional regulator